MRCPTCGKENAEHYKWCLSCAAELHPAGRGGAPAPAGPPGGRVPGALLMQGNGPAGAPEAAHGWQALDGAPQFVTVTMSVTCDHCAQPVPVNGPARSVHCSNCEGDTPLRRVPEELALAAEGSQLLGSPYKKRTFESPAPQCRKCGAMVPIDGYLVRTGGSETIPCPHCGTGLPTYPAPGWLRQELPSARQIFGGDPEVAQAEAGIAVEVDQQKAAPVVMSCPQCNGSLTITPETPRTVACSYCSTQVFLPDALWTRMHPAKVMRRWTVTYVGALKTQEDLQEAEQERREAEQERREEQHTEVQRKKSSTRARWLGILGVAAAIAVGIVVFFVVGKGCSKAEGKFTSTGEPIGDRTIEPKKCKSGQHEGFRGVVLLTDDDATAIRVVEDPVKGTLVQVQKRETCKGNTCEYVVFDREECTQFDVSIESTNTTVNDIRVLEGYLRLDCKFAETGGTAQADITFTCD